MTSYSDIATRAAAQHLEVCGAFHPVAGDGAPEGCATLLLLGPREPGFWAHVTAAPEFHDTGADPVDRWSRRVITELADALGGRALMPLDGPPWQPFVAWAYRSGRTWRSPVALLVHDGAGLMLSYRGALSLPFHVDLPPAPAAPPCATCPQPCARACPVAALSAEGYDTATCHAFLDTDAGADCMRGGVRRAAGLPGQPRLGRDPAQSAYHMRSFHP
ncbi:Ferredoxin [Roseibacterium elongatum DSM 19469]|uniref:Ferredoxin n=1 Tax=Roseicyclus elongatus DSM 19469 TaxID=1294273 RepID=W8RSB1_9RHOB|nr:hypothetical protein [Roseibacterium elongatum]AHM03983.1 Ferredoxin [Roseibacterium elongatum DSM 19469]